MTTFNDLDLILYALDPSRLMEALGLTPDLWQRTALRSTDDRLLMLCARQTGKSTTTAALGLNTALTQEGSLVLLLSPSQRQSGELFRKIQEFHRALGRIVPSVAETATTLFLANGSRVVSLPGNAETIRGYSGARLVIIDEAAMTMDELFTAAAPMVAASKGRLVALSTPYGQRGWFYDAWESPTGPWRKIKATAAECPRIDVEEQRKILGDWQYRQEMECTFEAADNQVFSTEVVKAAFETTEQPFAW